MSESRGTARGLNSRLHRAYNTSFTLLAILMVSILLLGWSCNAIDRDEPIPSYLHIAEYELSVPSDNSQGSAATDIRDVWLDVNGQSIGVFEVPVTVPVLDNNDDLLVLAQAGVRNNGRSDNRIRYPFYKIYRDTIKRIEGALDTIRPVITYIDGAVFPWLEDFEDRTISMEIQSDLSTIDTFRLTGDSAEVYNYNTKNRFSAYLDLGTGEQNVECWSIPTFDFPRGRAVYLEIHFRTDVLLTFGIIPMDNDIQAGRVSILTLKETGGQWNKAYISLGEDINNQSYDDMNFKVFMSAFNDGTKTNPKVFIDNIKVIHQ